MDEPKLPDQPTPDPHSESSSQGSAEPSFTGYYRGEQAAKSSAIDQIVPVKNGLALMAYYLGVFSLIPCFGALLGPAAVICGVYGLKKVAKQPELPGKAHAWVGIVLGALMGIVNFAVIVWAVLQMGDRPF